MPSFVVIWIWLCAYLNCAGWALSWLHQLNAGGYAVALALGWSVMLVWQRKSGAKLFPPIRWPQLRRRFRRGFPLAFLALATLAFLGGALYGPNNFDAMAYRLPRVLNWLAADQWHWIHTIFPRLNSRCCGGEWLTAPLLAFTHSDRLLFLINLISFLLLPGLVFSGFTRLGVRPRVAWHWMWLVPSGYGLVLQAGSNGNDLLGAVFALAAMDFALRAKNSRSPRDFFTALLAAALMTGAKMSNLALLLPCGAALWFSRKLIIRHPLKTVCLGLLALAASALPTMVFNQWHCGDWMGNEVKLSHTDNRMVLRTTATLANVALQNLTPPVFPLAGAWNKGVPTVLSPELQARLHQTMAESGAAEFRLPEMQMEESAGLGFGLTLLLPASFLAALWLGRKGPGRPIVFDQQWVLRWLPVVAFMAVMTQGGLSAIARLIIPFYALLLPVWLMGPGHEPLIRKCWWRVAAYAVFAGAAFLLVISPARPLFPAMTLLEKFPSLPARVTTVYSVYHGRHDAFAPARAALPPGLKTLGFISYDDPEAALWWPLGSLRVVPVCPQDTPAELKQRGIEYVLASEEKIEMWFGLTADAWAKKMDAQVIRKIPLSLRAAWGPRDWDLIRLN